MSSKASTRTPKQPVRFTANVNMKFGEKELVAKYTGERCMAPSVHVGIWK